MQSQIPHASASATLAQLSAMLQEERDLQRSFQRSMVAVAAVLTVFAVSMLVLLMAQFLP